MGLAKFQSVSEHNNMGEMQYENATSWSRTGFFAHRKSGSSRHHDRVQWKIKGLWNSTVWCPRGCCSCNKYPLKVKKCFYVNKEVAWLIIVPALSWRFAFKMYDSVFEVISCKGRSGGKMERNRYVCCFKKDNIRPKLLQLTEAKSEALRSDWRRNLSFSFQTT